MVIQSTKDYDRHKLDVYEVIKKKYGEARAQAYLKHYSERYDAYGRSFIDYRLAFWLMDDYSYVNRVGTRWYAFVGIGGQGKSTLAKNVFYFLDKEFSNDQVHTTTLGFIKSFSGFQKNNALRAVLMDEPDDEHTSTSEAGKKLRKIFGKARQQKLFLGVCATDLSDIPPYMFRKLDGLFFLPYLGKYWFFRNRPKKGSYVLQEIRRWFPQKGYKIFYQLKNDAGCLIGQTHGSCPLDHQNKEKYLKDKRDDYDNDIKDFIRIAEQKGGSERESILRRLASKGWTDEQISEVFGVSRVRVVQMRAQYGIKK